MEKLIREWLNINLKNQYELRKQNHGIPFTMWNDGYLACLLDLEETINNTTPSLRNCEDVYI